MGGNLVSTLRSNSRKRPLPDEFRIHPRIMKKRRLYHIIDDREMEAALKEGESGAGDSNSTEPEIQSVIELLSLLGVEQTEGGTNDDNGYEGDDELSAGESESGNKSEPKDESEAENTTEENEPQDKRVILLETIIDIRTHTHSIVYNFEGPVQGADPIIQQLLDEALAETNTFSNVDSSTLQKAVKKAVDEEREDALCHHFERAITMPSSAAMDLDEQDEE
ncbi:hypothetical protein FSARC_5067 [Fusarium sarcochroum]|uniref:Uncharacterized protein n=1 Tax=Fusarium sarcochroum TaxID=1208366 RepID=A0A8H4U0L5_9HYPO|nr:hypothetical protein FSARC_5067 [Fusarium sarcochroum]